ncbi:MAG: type II secretion system F family protein [Anaerolineae bacterium]
MNANVILALLGAAGVFLAFNGLTAPRTVRLEKPSSDEGLMAKLQARLDAAELPVTAREFVTLYAVLAFAMAGVGLFLGAPALALAGLIVVPALLWQRYEARRDDFRQKYDQSLAETVQLLREGFSATGALRDALDHTVRNGPDPAAADFREVWRGQATGLDLEEAFAPVVERRRNPFLRMVAEALALKASEGGDVGEILLGLERMIRGQVILRREIAAKQSQARMESTVVSLAPIGFFLAMKLLPWMRTYESGFYRTPLGQIALAVVIVFSMLAFFLARRLAVRGLTMEVKEIAPAVRPQVVWET